MHLTQLISCGYRRVDIIADTNRPTSIKDPGCLKRGCVEKVMVKSASSLLPNNFDDFLKNGDNKNRPLEIFKQVFQFLHGSRIGFFLKLNYTRGVDHSNIFTFNLLIIIVRLEICKNHAIFRCRIESFRRTLFKHKLANFGLGGFNTSHCIIRDTMT